MTAPHPHTKTAAHPHPHLEVAGAVAALLLGLALGIPAWIRESATRTGVQITAVVLALAAATGVALAAVMAHDPAPAIPTITPAVTAVPVTTPLEMS